MKYTILAVDDNKLVLTMIKHAFSSELSLYNVITAENGKIAYELAIEKNPDLILLDLEMPVMDGLQTLEHLKRNDQTKDIPVIMVTSSKYLPVAFEAGATDFIHKPIDKIELLVRVKSTLSLFKLLQSIIKQSEQLELQSEQLELQKARLEDEKRKTDTLLLNILPYEVAEQLKNKGYVQAKHYRMVSVLFTDFEGFTRISEMLSSEEIVRELSICFEKFDEIVEKHYIEKIKTIGDAYMCAGGLPIRNKSNPIDVALASLKVQKFMGDYNKIKRSLNQPEWNLRIGIHTGEVVAGVIGKKKFAYDIWGDTVNTASRMESSGAPGRVNISGDTYKYIKDYFDCSYRGKVQAKNKGEIDMYFIEGLKAEYSSDEEHICPNEKFLDVLSSF